MIGGEQYFCFAIFSMLMFDFFSLLMCFVRKLFKIFRTKNIIVL